MKNAQEQDTYIVILSEDNLDQIIDALEGYMKWMNSFTHGDGRKEDKPFLMRVKEADTLRTYLERIYYEPQS